MRPSLLIGLLMILGASAAAAGGVILLWSHFGRDGSDADGLANFDKPGFQDMVASSGITFRMEFLPNEQGEKFKVNLYDHGCGVAVADIDGDGFEDVYFVNQLGPNALYKNQGDGTFTEVTQTAGVAVGDRICVGATFADFDNDGRPDLYVTSTRGGNILFHNLGEGKFKDVTEDAGLKLIAHCQSAVFFDYDNDGFLDLFVTCTAQWTLNRFDDEGRYYPGPGSLWELAASRPEDNVLYRNEGNGKFTDVTKEAGVRGLGWGGDVAVLDFDDDGNMDMLVTNMFGLSQLYRNDGNGRFTDVTATTLKRTSWGAIGCKAFDYNNDGKLDLLIVDMHSDMWSPNRASQETAEFVKDTEHVRYTQVQGPKSKSPQKEDNRLKMENKFADIFKINYDRVIFGNTLYKNLGMGKFIEVTEEARMETWWPWGIVTGDFDNDGYEDVFLPSGMGYPFFYWPNRLMMNNGNETFSEQSGKLGIEPPVRGKFSAEPIGFAEAARSSRCAAVADFRGVGRLDIITNNFNDLPYYFQNNLAPKNYVAFQLEGKKSNRDAIGALVRIHLGKEVMVRQVHPAGGYLSQSSRRVHFGLGDRAKIDRVEIRWPSGIRQTIQQPEINKLHQVAEPAS